MKNKALNIFYEVLPMFCALIIFIFIKNEYLIALGVLALLLITFKIKYYKNEWKVYVFGVLTGFFFEIAGDYIYKLQYWENASLFGIPIWLPLLWGYGFIFIRRIGNLFVNNN